MRKPACLQPVHGPEPLLVPGDGRLQLGDVGGNAGQGCTRACRLLQRRARLLVPSWGGGEGKASRGAAGLAACVPLFGGGAS